MADTKKRKPWKAQPLQSHVVEIEDEEYLTIAKGRFPAFLAVNNDPNAEPDEKYIVVFEYEDEDGDLDATKIELSEAQAQGFLKVFTKRVKKLPKCCPLELPPPVTRKAPEPDPEPDPDPNE